MELPINQILCGDCIKVMKTFPDESIDMTMFSPPYWGLRDYGIDGQIGLEKHPNEYIVKMLRVCGAVKRVLKKSGSLYLNLGDTYYGSGKGRGTTTHSKNLPYEECHPLVQQTDRSNWLQPKQKLMMPSRVAIALQHDGWILRNDIIWHKPNHMPSSVKDRLTNAYEHIFHFVKARKYFYDLDAIRQPHKKSGDYKNYGKKLKKSLRSQLIGTRDYLGKPNHPLGKNPSDIITYKGKFNGFNEEAEKFGSPRARTQRKKVIKVGMHHGSSLTKGRATHYEGQLIEGDPRGKNPSDFWSINTKPYKEAHFAVYPEAICERPIKSSCPNGGVVLDPMCGSGTTLVVAHKLGRRWIGIDLNLGYVEMAKKRLMKESKKLSSFL